MTISKKSLLAIASAAILLSGCATSRFGDAGSPNNIMPHPQRFGGVTQTDLAPPEGYPVAPASDVAQSQPNQDQGTQVASLEAPTNASDLTPASVAGVWKASIGGMNCQIATPQTKYGQGYRAGALRCPAAFAGVSSWAVSGKQLGFYDGSGSSVATLYSSSAGRFEGRTVSGQTVVLSR